MFSAWCTKCRNFLFLTTLLSLFFFSSFFFFFFVFFISTGKRYPFTSLVPNTQNYVTGTMKFQRVLLTCSDLWVPSSSQHIYFHSLVLFFQLHSRICIKFALWKIELFLYFPNHFLPLWRWGGWTCPVLVGSSQMLNQESI